MNWLCTVHELNILGVVLLVFCFVLLCFVMFHSPSTVASMRLSISHENTCSILTRALINNLHRNQAGVWSEANITLTHILTYTDIDNRFMLLLMIRAMANTLPLSLARSLDECMRVYSTRCRFPTAFLLSLSRSCFFVVSGWVVFSFFLTFVRSLFHLSYLMRWYFFSIFLSYNVFVCFMCILYFLLFFILLSMRCYF